MALQWDFNEKAGTVTQVYGGKEYTSNFYEGNALMIVTNEFEENGKELYTVQWFFTDELHAKRCLGLAKCVDGTQHNMFAQDGAVKRMTVYKEHCRSWKKLVLLFLEAFGSLEIDIREKEPESERSDHRDNG